MWDQHHDGASETSLVELARRCGDRATALFGIALATGFCLAVGFVAVIPGLALAAGLLVAVPVLVLEGLPVKRALMRSRELVRGNEAAVVRVAASAIAVVLIAQAPLVALAALDGDRIGFWITATAAAAVTVPYLAYVAIVGYFALTEPDRPIVLEPDEHWYAPATDDSPSALVDV